MSNKKNNQTKKKNELNEKISSKQKENDNQINEALNLLTK